MKKLFKTKTRNNRWADGAVVYQIYPRSFQDSNGDGIGDLPGIIDRLDYLKELGVTAIWLSPFYTSPMADFGYDVADYCDVDPMFGTMDDFKRLLKEAHARGIRIVIDIVPNHTSDDHQWFKTSKTSASNEYSDWYVWKDPKSFENGQPVPPNNWVDVFAGKSAWEWVPERQQFYLHSFHVRQPDLNWENPNVRAALKDVLRFWLELGVDGFRVDAVPFMAKDPQYRDEPGNPDYVEGRDWPYIALQHIYNQADPKLYGYLAGMAEVLKEKRFAERPRFMVTEGYTERVQPVEEYLRYYRGMDPAVAAPFIFEGIELPWKAELWRTFLTNFHAALGKLSPLALASYAFGNHDQWRLVTRLGEERARAAAVMKLTLPGMIFVYYGEDIGMHNVEIPADRIQDPGALGDTQKGQGRDPERTPMQWSTGKNAGFSTAKQTWLPVAPDYKECSVEVESKLSDSFLALYKQLINLRKSTSAIRIGSIDIEQDGGDVLAYTRKHGRESYTTIVNFSDQPNAYPFGRDGHILLSSRGPRAEMVQPHSTIKLEPHEAIVIAKAQ